MDMRNPLFLPSLAFALCAGAAPPTVYAAAGAAGIVNRVKINKPVRPVQSLGTPFVLFRSPDGLRAAAAARPHRPRQRPPVDRDRSADEDKSAALTDLLQTIVPPPITVTVKPSPLAPRRYVAVLTSADPVDPAEVVEAVKQAQAAVGSLVFVVSNIRTPDPIPPEAPVPLVTLTYTLRFLRGALPTVTGTAPAQPTPARGLGRTPPPRILPVSSAASTPARTPP